MLGNSVRYLRIINLEQQAVLSVVRVALLGDLVTGPPDLHKFLYADFSSLRGGLYGRFFGFLCSSARKILLMLLSLGVSQVTSFVCMQGQAKLALIRPQMIFHEVRIFVQVNRLQSQLP